MIVDTNALSAFAEGNQGVRETIAAAPGPYLPVIVIGEYRFGLMTSRDRDRRMAWLEELMRHWIVLEISSATAASYAEIRCLLKRRSTPIPANDVWIAALARQHGLPVLTADSHLDAVPGVQRISW
jgi:predicted nucleic acid-binding protein